MENFKIDSELFEEISEIPVCEGVE